jgi:hypothetical protein
MAACGTMEVPPSSFANRLASRDPISFGNSGGLAEGYCFAVQSYCPPKVTQRSLRVRAALSDKGEWMAVSLGVSGGEVVGLSEKKDWV